MRTWVEDGERRRLGLGRGARPARALPRPGSPTRPTSRARWWRGSSSGRPPGRPPRWCWPTEDLLLTCCARPASSPRKAPWFTHHHLDLARLAPVPDVPGYRLRAVRAGRGRAARRVPPAAWGRREHPRDDRGVRRPDGDPALRPDLDWVAVAADGTWVASCLVWLDPATGVALVEPVGCAPDHRRRGLAGGGQPRGAARGARRRRHRGAGLPARRPRYPAPQALYQGSGSSRGSGRSRWCASRERRGREPARRRRRRLSPAVRNVRSADRTARRAPLDRTPTSPSSRWAKDAKPTEPQT